MTQTVYARHEEILRRCLDILKQRETQYGDIVDTFEQTAVAWSSLLRSGGDVISPIDKNPETGEIETRPILSRKMAALMMASMKLNRAAKPPYDIDHYIDAINYILAAHQAAWLDHQIKSS
jgi:hypothetical protein